MNISMALPHRISGTCDKAKKYNGDKKTENGILSNLIVDAESILPGMILER
jgi:hypothetical protein